MREGFLDIETGSADELYTYGPGYCRLAGIAVDDGPVVLTTDMDEVCDFVRSVDRIWAHNAIGFDLAALEHWHGLDVAELVEQGQVRDSLILARLNDPPLPGKADVRRYGLDALSHRLLGEGKVGVSGISALKKLAEEHGGYDRIPVDDPTYRRYLVRDVELLRSVSRYLACDAYGVREHRVMYRLSQISRNGWRVDVAEAQRRLAVQGSRSAELIERLARRYGLPTAGKAPHRTKAGIEALEKAFADVGVVPSRTANGSLATGKDAVQQLLKCHPDNSRLHSLCNLLLSLNGQRSVTQTVLDHVGADGRVHPSIDAGQSTGRLSVTKPGLTVMGKRDRANVLERSLLLPDEGDVLVAVDLSQVDARAVAAHCQDPAYIDAFAPGKDFHTEMAVALFGDPARRSDAKPVTHATTYGMGPRGLATSAGIPQAEAEKLIRTLDKQFPVLGRWKQAIRREAERGFIYSAWGRPMRIERGREYTTAPASLGQGTARDILAEGILRLPQWLIPCLRGVVHDEIVLSVPVDRADEAEAAVLAAMQFEMRLSPDAIAVLVLADKSDRGRDWADCYRGEKTDWPEVARSHRDLAGCDAAGCLWHGGEAAVR
ncbi:DNA polymerase [Gordonia polyisoprenivorans]|uniref:DNA polymerase n=1 Tax=Gordonia polyisoprenivorans TaxID=84595 RepID=UPI00223484AE|nr:DNA polymerase [Gordonia polyisoprenivorans]